MRTFLVSIGLSLAAILPTRAAEPFEIKDGDRVLFLGDTLLEREGTYGYLETRMVEQFPDRKFTVRNLAFSADTPLGWSRASFDPPAKGFERLKEQLALVKPTVVFLGYGMAASLQEMTDRSQDWTLNRDPARYGAEPMSAARFKKELAQCMDAIVEISAGAHPDGTAANAADAARGKDAANPASPNSSSAAPAASAAVKKSPVRFVLLSPIQHEDLRHIRPGLPDPTEHNKLLEQYTKAIEELAKERGARFVDFAAATAPIIPAAPRVGSLRGGPSAPVQTFLTDNGIHLNQYGYAVVVHRPFVSEMGWTYSAWQSELLQSEMKAREIERGFTPESSKRAYELETNARKLLRARDEALRAAIIRKNALFFHRWRPANETYLFGFRKREQGQNAAEIPKFDPLIEAAEAEIERLKKAASATAPLPNDERRASGRVGVSPEPSSVERTPNRDTPSGNARNSTPDGPRETRGPAGGTPALPEANATASAPSAAAASNTNTANNPESPAETPGLSKIAASPSTLPLPTFTLADGLEISLWAENPFLAKPTECNWDAQGRLWVASSAMYPMIAPGQEATDKIIIIEDPGHTGKATKSTVFVDGLLIPTGVAPVLVQENEGVISTSVISAPKSTPSQTAEPLITNHSPTNHSPARWACYVGQSTELLYFEDTKGTGKADKKRIVFSGFGTEDTHHIVHTLRWGPDGRLYFSQSVYIHTHMETPWGVVRVNSGGVFAYDPRTERVEVVEKGLWNTWGHAWDKWGQSFYTDGAGSTGLSWGFPGATFAPNEGARRTMASISPGSYPKFAGLEIIYSPHFPADWQGSAVTCDFRAHKIVHFEINDLGAVGTAANAAGAAEGKNAANPASPNSSSSAAPAAPAAVDSPKSGYVTEQLPVLVQTSDATFRPIDVKLGPDGALYIADWSNPIINHGEVDFRDPRRDHEHGRIWRLSMKGGAPVKWESLVGKTTEELVEKVMSKNFWEKDQARCALQTNVNQSRRAQYQGMWQDLNQALKDMEGGRRPKITKEDLLKEIAKHRGFSEQDLSEEGTLTKTSKFAFPGHDTFALQERSKVTNARVRLEAMRALARIPLIEHASLILDAAIDAPKDDPYYDFAAWLSINDLAEVWTKAVLAGEWKLGGREKQFEFALNAIEPALAGQVLSQFVSTGRAPLDGSGPWIELIGKTGDKAALQMLFERVAESGFDHERSKGQVPRAKDRFDEAAGVRALNALAEAARLRNLRPEGPLTHAAVLIHSDYTGIRIAAARLAALWKLNEAAPHLEALATQPDAAQRAAAFDGLRNLGGADAVASLKRLLRSDFPPVPPAALAVLAQLNPGAAIAEIPAVLGAIKSEPDLLATWRAIFQSKGAVNQLAANFPANLPKPAINSALRAARELGRPGQRLVAKLTPLAGEKIAAAVPPANYTDLAARANKDGDPVAGEAMYRRTASACTTCHAIGGAGGKLGPDLTSIGASAPPDYIIESVLDPAAKVKEGYHAFAFAMKDGTETIGIPVRETPQEQFIRTITGEQSLAKAGIVSKKLAEGGASLMPAGLTAAWTDLERLNLYAFLMQLGRPGPFDASKNNVARVWQLTDSGKVDRPLKMDSYEITNPVYTRVDGRLTKDLLADKLAMLAPKTDAVHLSARFQAATAGRVKLNLTGVSKAWLDLTPLAVASEPSPSVDLTAGVHTFTVEVDLKAVPDVLRLESPAVSFLGN